MEQEPVVTTKKSQIDSSNRTMFLWVIGVSIVLGIAIVLVVFLAQMLLFNERVLSKKSGVVKDLEASLQAVPELEANVKKLDANQALIDSKTESSDRAIQVVMDALPALDNSLALGASLQNKLLDGIPGLTVTSLQVDEAIEKTDNNAGGSLSFTFTVEGDDQILQQVLVRLESSLRTINVEHVGISSSGNKRSMTIKGQAYYEPAVRVELKEEIVK